MAGSEAELVDAPITYTGGYWGILLGIGFEGVTFSLRSIGIIPAALLTGLDGIAASLIAWAVLGQRQPPATVLASICAGGGAFFLWLVAPGAWLADILALLTGLLFCIYALYIERTALLAGANERMWAFFGILFATMGLQIVAAGEFSWPSLPGEVFFLRGMTRLRVAKK